MKTSNQKKEVFLFHPVLFGLYPVLALYLFNRNEIAFISIQRAFLSSLFFTILVIGIFFLIFRSWQKAAAPASLTFLLFYSYGHVYDFARATGPLGEVIGRARLLIPLWILFFILGLILLVRSKRTTFDQVLNSVSAFLMIFLFVQLLFPLIQAGSAQANTSDVPSVEPDDSPVNAPSRDVYYILVDAYSRQDLLQQKYGLDTSNFISELKSLGFYIPDCAQSNYDATFMSMTATLNMNYLDALEIDYFGDKAKYDSYIQNNVVMKRFEKMGYGTVTFRSLHPRLDMPDSTYYYDYFEDTPAWDSLASLNFQYLFLKTTFLRPLVDTIERNQNITVPSYLAVWLPTANTLDSREYRQYQQNLFAFDSLETIPDLPGKKFVYAHLYTTHQPYVFYPDGRFHPFLQQDNFAYVDQVVYANTRLLGVVKAILSKSDPAPIIVIQSDHSDASGADRVKILNAYYLPDGGNDLLYPNITPVNTFRVIFNKYFDEHYELLPDVSQYVEDDVRLREAPSTCIGTAVK